MRTAHAPYWIRYKSLKVLASLRRHLLNRRTLRTGQLLLAAAQLILLGYLLEWIVSSLVHLPMVVTFLVVLVIVLPVFVLSWPLLRALSEQ